MLLVIGSIVSSAAVAAIDEAISFGAEDFGNPPLCCPGCDDLLWSHNQANAFDDEFDAWQFFSNWDESADYLTAGTDGRDFTDASVSLDSVTEEDDVESYGVDSADVGFIATHGSHRCDVWYNSVIEMGDENGEECGIHTRWEYGTAGDQDIELGDAGNNGDLELMFVDTCESAHHCTWENGGYSTIDGTGFQLWAGFHGDSYDSSEAVDDLQEYVAASYSNGVGENWLDYRYDARGVGADQCPTVIIWASSDSVADNFFANGGLKDRFNTGSHSMTGFYYLCDCDPSDGVVVEC